MSYELFVASKLRLHTPSGIDVPRESLHVSLFDHQKDTIGRPTRRTNSVHAANVAALRAQKAGAR